MYRVVKYGLKYPPKHPDGRITKKRLVGLFTTLDDAQAYVADKSHVFIEMPASCCEELIHED